MAICVSATLKKFINTKSTQGEFNWEPLKGKGDLELSFCEYREGHLLADLGWVD